MDVTLSYAAWLSQQVKEGNALTVIFNDTSSVLFSKQDHETHLVAAVTEAKEPNVD